MTKILLVEDDKSLREIYGVRLLAEGYDIVSAGDGEEALAMAIKDRPSLIVSDVMMPKISGFDMLDILRSTTETKDIKVIMMTALSSDDQRQRGVALGADRYLVKSQVGIEDVVRTVHEVLGDAPTSSAAQAQVAAPQSTPASQATQPAPTPAPAAPQMQPSAPAPQTAPQPTAPTMAPTPVAAPFASGATTMSTAPTDSPLPQPTAPFSTPRPANLGDRVIQPLTKDSPETDLSDMINRELSSIQSSSASNEVQTPQMPASPAPAPAPANPTSSPMNSPVSPETPQASLPPVPQAPQPSASDLNFEESPRNNSGV